MILSRQKITIINIRRPEKKDVNDELQWLGTSLGLFNLRDKDKSMFRLFIELLKDTKIREPLSSDELAERLGLSRGTVIHHLNKLMESGIVVSSRKRYYLRVENLKAPIEELEKDVTRACKQLREVETDIDSWMGL